MKIGIVGAGDFSGSLDPSMDYIAVDGGLEILENLGIVPIVVIGDFDSLEDKSLLSRYQRITLPKVKDDTDSAKAVDYALENGYNEINLFGVTGGRLDHFFAVVCLLKKYRFNQIYIFDNQNKIYLLTSGKHRIYKDGYQFLSFFAVDECTISIQGCAYTLDNYLLKQDDPLCVSNEILDDYADIEIDHDVIVIQSNNRKVK